MTLNQGIKSSKNKLLAWIFIKKKYKVAKPFFLIYSNKIIKNWHLVKAYYRRQKQKVLTLCKKKNEWFYWASS